MTTILHKAADRGIADHGWLKAAHSFSFGDYHNPDKVHFGVLRVLNDDLIAAGMGFSRHPHDNMEIITIPLFGALEHQDSMGNKAVITAGEVQVMSAGTGIEHSEKNASKAEPLSLLQIWLFPKVRNVMPRYAEMKLNIADRHNRLQQILSPSADDEGVWVHQDAWFHMGALDAGFSTSYSIKKEGNGAYIFVIKGEASITGQKLESRDALALTDIKSIEITADTDAEILIMDIPVAV